MFRKFLKVFPKADGKSTLDWEEHYVKAPSISGMTKRNSVKWTSQSRSGIIPTVAKQKIAGKIGEIALEENAKKIDFDLIIRGYIQATPKRDHKFLRKKLASMKIDLTPYEHLVLTEESAAR